MSNDQVLHCWQLGCGDECMGGACDKLVTNDAPLAGREGRSFPRVFSVKLRALLMMEKTGEPMIMTIWMIKCD